MAARNRADHRLRDAGRREPTPKRGRVSVYVDNARIPARVGRISGQWSHLTADTPAELHRFAERIGLRRGWFPDLQRQPGLPARVPVRALALRRDRHQRHEAIAAGAKLIDLRQLADIIRQRRSPPGE